MVIATLGCLALFLELEPTPSYMLDKLPTTELCLQSHFPFLFWDRISAVCPGKSWTYDHPVSASPSSKEDEHVPADPG